MHVDTYLRRRGLGSMAPRAPPPAASHRRRPPLRLDSALLARWRPRGAPTLHLRVKRSTRHTHTHRQRTTPPTPTHTHDKNNTSHPQTNTSHKHFTTPAGEFVFT